MGGGKGSSTQDPRVTRDLWVAGHEILGSESDQHVFLSQIVNRGGSVWTLTSGDVDVTPDLLISKITPGSGPRIPQSLPSKVGPDHPLPSGPRARSEGFGSESRGGGVR